MAEPKFGVNLKTGHKFRVGGCLVKRKLTNYPKFGSSRVVASHDLPQSVDLRSDMTPIERQEQMASCVGNAIAGAYEFLIKSRTQKHIDVSRLFIYYNGRIEDGVEEFEMTDEGTSIPSAIEGVKKYGSCKEKFFPYVAENANRKPSPDCYTEAFKHRVKEVVEINLNLDEMKACLAEGYPFVFALHLFQSFMDGEYNGGNIKTPDPHSEQEAVEHGWHAMLAVGYSNAKQCFIARNSWGDDWGDRGYCYIPYDYMSDSEHCADLYAIKSFLESDHPQREDAKVNPINPNVNYNYDSYTPVDNVHGNTDYSNPQYYNYENSNYSNPQDNTYENFDYRNFWNTDDQDNYGDVTLTNNTDTSSPYTWTAESSTDHYENNEWPQAKNQSSINRILWIDEKNSDNTYVVNQINNEENIEVDFCETFSQAESYLSTNMNKINSSATFQIVCRGYYRSENKNPLNLLEMLNKHRINHVSILVFTQDKAGLEYHLYNQASSMNLNDWQKRLFIANNSDELIRKIKENIHKNQQSI